MTQQPDGIRRDADVPVEPAAPDASIQAVHFVFLAIVIYLLFPLWVSVADAALRQIGFYVWYYGPDLVAMAAGPKSPQQKAAAARLNLWAVATAFPFWFASIALLLSRLPAAYRRDLGVSASPRREPRASGQLSETLPLALGSRRGLGGNILIGFAAGVLIVPPVLSVNALVLWLHQRYIPVTEEKHPLTIIGESGGLPPVEWVLLAFSVMVWAPLSEELFFRGALPALCRKVRSGGHAAMLLAAAAALFMRRDAFAAAGGDSVKLFYAAMPALFVVGMVPVYLVVCWLSRTQEGPVLFGTALLFAAGHSFAWPTPVALFLLGLGLGGLAVWTRSLIAPIVLHMVFNATSFVLLLLG
jgi:membrane protease YdiL (CAAX protease family)